MSVSTLSSCERYVPAREKGAVTHSRRLIGLTNSARFFFEDICRRKTTLATDKNRHSSRNVLSVIIASHLKPYFVVSTATALLANYLKPLPETCTRIELRRVLALKIRTAH